jgi:hypothetical protein
MMRLRSIVAGTVPAMAPAMRPQGGPAHRQRSAAAGTSVEDLDGGKIWSASDREEYRYAAGEIFPPDRLERDGAGSTPSRDMQGWSAMHRTWRQLARYHGGFQNRNLSGFRAREGPGARLWRPFPVGLAGTNSVAPCGISSGG